MLYLRKLMNVNNIWGVVYGHWGCKVNPERHGIGLLNIRDVVHKYDGAMNIETEKGVFVISVLVPLSDSEHDINQAV